MTIKAPVTVMLAVTIILAASQAMARDTVIALSPFDTVEDQRGNVESLAHHLLETVAPGETAHVINGYTLDHIASFEVPDGDAYENPRAKIGANAEFLGEMKRFFEAADPAPNRVGQLDIPGLLRHVGDFFPAEHASDLIIIGSPVHDDPKQPSLSMLGGAVPNDGHIGATQAQSPYGAAGRKDKLAQNSVLFVMPNLDWRIHAQHATAVERFLALATHHQGAHLGAFTTDLSSALRLAGSNVQPLPFEPLSGTDKLEMISFSPDIADLPVIYDREVTTEVPSERTLRFAELVEVGISWNCGACDLDVYAQAGPEVDIIYFGNPYHGAGAQNGHVDRPPCEYRQRDADQRL